MRLTKKSYRLFSQPHLILEYLYIIYRNTYFFIAFAIAFLAEAFA